MSWDAEHAHYFCYQCKDFVTLAGEVEPLVVEHIDHGTALINASPSGGASGAILNSIDKFCIAVQKMVGGFPKETLPRSPSIYANPPLPGKKEIEKYVAIGAALILIAALLLFFVSWLQHIWLFMFAFVGPLLYLWRMWRTDRYEREPRLYVFIVFAMGFFTTIGAYILNSYVVGPFLGGFSAPIVEEVLKGLCVFWVARKEEFNDGMDGMAYGFAAGMGFAVSENFFYILFRYEGDLLSSALRVFLWAFGHGLYTSMTGRWMGKMKVLTGSMKVQFLVPGLIVAMIMHFVYNEVAGLIFPIIGNVVWDIVCLLIVLSAIRQALMEERRWGYDKGLAPVDKVGY